MYSVITIEELVENFEKYLIVDVRSEHEFNEDCIPQAISMPIFSDEEHRNIGIKYKEDQNQAILLGIEYASKKVLDFAKFVLNANKPILFYCSRGGFRSRVITELLYNLKMYVRRLDGGYKSYRKYVRDSIPLLLNSVEINTIYGNTGTGKTILLNKLRDRGVGVLDLERYANHRGSSLGAIGKNPHSQKKFESLLWYDLFKQDKKFYYIEGESRKIGKVQIPDPLFKKMTESKKIYVYSDIKFRVDNIYDEYINDESIEIISNTLSVFENYLTKKQRQILWELFNNKQYRQLIEFLCIEYYDIKYKYKPEQDTLVIKNDKSNDALDKLEYLANLYNKR